MTRVLTVGDLHGETGRLLDLLDRLRPDGLLGVGDWGDPGQVSEETWRAILGRVPVLTVFGNHDDIAVLTTLRNGDGSPVLLGQGERRVFCGLSIAGVSGIWAKSHRLPHYVTDEDVAGWAEAIAATVAVDGPLDVLLTHGCPLGVADRTPSGRPGGQACFRGLLKAVRPQAHLYGHLHVAQVRTLAEPPCTVVNTGALPLDKGPFVLLDMDAASGGLAVQQEFFAP